MNDGAPNLIGDISAYGYVIGDCERRGLFALRRDGSVWHYNYDIRKWNKIEPIPEERDRHEHEPEPADSIHGMYFPLICDECDGRDPSCSQCLGRKGVWLERDLDRLQVASMSRLLVRVGTIARTVMRAIGNEYRLFVIVDGVKYAIQFDRPGEDLS